MEMDENNSVSEASNCASDRDLVEVSSKNYEMLKNDAMNRISAENGISDVNSNFVVNEASKIYQMGMEKDYIILEKTKMIQNAVETIENMKKNMYHIQTEYEQLNQNYQKEVSNTAEALKRLDATKEMIESVLHYANILATSIKQLEDDKFKIAEFYNELNVRQEDEEQKRKKIEIIIKEHEDLVKSTVAQLILEKDKTEQKLNTVTNNLFQTENDLKFVKEKKNELEIELQKLIDEMKEMKSNLVLEQSNRIKYQVIQSQLKKKILQQKDEDEKTLNMQKVLHRRELKLLKSKVKNLRERLASSEGNLSNYLNTIKHLDRKVIDLNDNLEKAFENHKKEVQELTEKLNIYLNEKSNLDNSILTMEQENREANLKIKTLTEENVTLVNAQETMKSTLQEKENQVEKLLEENLNLDSKAKSLLLEINSKIQKVSELETEISSHNTEELTEKIKIYEEELLHCNKIEKELRNEIVLLNETISKECCENEKVMLENRTRIQQLEKEVSELQAQKEAAEKQLNHNYTEYNQVKNELILKSADLEKITQEFESKMRMVSNEAELSEEFKINLEKEKQLNKELLQRVQKLEDEKTALDGDLIKALDREKSLNKNLEQEKKEADKTIRQLNQKIEQGDRLFKIQEEKLKRAENEILEMENVLEKVKSSEEIINGLKKSLESSEANVEAYKMVIKKLEGEAEKLKNTENETIKNLRSKISQLKQLNQNNENFMKLLETPRSRNSRGVNKNESVASTPRKTPTTSRKLFSTPKRLLENPYPSPNFNAISPIMKTRDPYDYDSDSVEQPNKVLSNFQSSPKAGIFTSKRKK